jgi:hypothetical protein
VNAGRLVANDKSLKSLRSSKKRQSSTIVANHNRIANQLRLECVANHQTDKIIKSLRLILAFVLRNVASQILENNC